MQAIHLNIYFGHGPDIYTLNGLPQLADLETEQLKHNMTKETET